MNRLFTLLFTLCSFWGIGQTSEIVLLSSNASRHEFIANLSPTLHKFNASVSSSVPAVQADLKFIWVIEFPEAQETNLLTELRTLPNVELAELNLSYEAVEIDRLEPSDPAFHKQWGADNNSFNPGTIDSDINLPETWFLETGSSDITLAIIDSGVDELHPEFAGRMYSKPAEVGINGVDEDNNGFTDDYSGWDFVEGDNFTNDENGHGTSVAGVAAANGDNNLGIAGVDWNCKILDVRVLNANGSGSFANVSAGIYYAVNEGADVINLSLGGTNSSSVITNAIDYALQNNVLVIAAMGNDGVGTPFYPASIDGVFSVGATNYFDERCDPFKLTNNGGSNYGSHIDVVAPGDYIIALNKDDYTDFSDYSAGTSLAAPFVSGLATLLMAHYPESSATDIATRIRISADDQVGKPTEDISGFDIYYGYGRVNAYEAVSSTILGEGEDFVLIANFDNSSISVVLNTSAAQLVVTTIDGKIIYSEYQPALGVRTLNVSSGVYLATVSIQGEYHTRKVVVI